MREVRTIVEKHSDGFVAYPVGIRGVAIGQGDTYEEALEDVRSAVCAHVETFGSDVIEDGEPASGVFLTEAHVPIQ